MASLSKSKRNGRNYFRCQFFTDSKRHAVYLGPIKESAANKIQAKIGDLETSAKLKIKPEGSTLEWIQNADWKLIGKLDSLGLMTQVQSLIFKRRNAESGDDDKRPTLLEFCQWYIEQRKSDCEPSTIKKNTASLNQLCDYCRDVESVQTIDDLTAEIAFRYQLHRLKSKAEATVSADVKIAKTAFRYGVKAGIVSSSPFAELKAGSDVNPDGKHILPISDYEKLIDACTDSDWRTIIALARLGGLRCPSELTHLKWTDINWSARTVRVTSPKTKRHGRAERTFPLFDRLDQALSDHWDLRGESSEFVITQEHLRRPGVSLSERFNEIRKLSGVSRFDSPFRNMRVSAVNDVCRIPGITPKTISDWFGHDLKTAMKYYNQTTSNDLYQALSFDPFIDSVIATTGPDDAQDDARTSKNDAERKSTNQKTPRNKRISGNGKSIKLPD